jgi:hypothetical protein
MTHLSEDIPRLIYAQSGDAADIDNQLRLYPDEVLAEQAARNGFR